MSVELNHVPSHGTSVHDQFVNRLVMGIVSAVIVGLLGWIGWAQLTASQTLYGNAILIHENTIAVAQIPALTLQVANLTLQLAIVQSETHDLEQRQRKDDIFRAQHGNSDGDPSDMLIKPRAGGKP